MEKSFDLLIPANPIIDFNTRMQDTFPITYGKTYNCSSMKFEAGGSGNICFALAHMGSVPLPAGSVGNDELGHMAISRYTSEGVDVSEIKFDSSKSTPISVCVVDNDGRHSFITQFTGETFESHTLEELTELVKKCRGMYYTGYNLVDSNSDICRKFIALAETAHKLGINVFFDTGPVIGAVDRDIIDKALKSATLFTMNQDEAFAVTGTEDYAEAAEMLCKKTEASVLIKVGAKGCYVKQGNNEGKLYRGFTVKVADTMGCGDCFYGGVIHGFLKGWIEEQYMCLGNAVGAVMASKYGTGSNAPSFGEVCSLLEDNGYSVPDTDKGSNSFKLPPEKRG